MPDLIDNSEAGGDEVSGGSKHGEARALAEAALRARDAGNDARADMLLEEARRTDPQAVENLLMELGPHEHEPQDHGLEDGPATDEEVAAISRTLRPHADAPSRAGITGSGSGAESH
jgi:hypothetical protein